MNGKIVIRPGTPDDANRDYLPEIIKTTDVVVNENGNNSQPYPVRLKEFAGVIADGQEDMWYEYVPESYDPSRKTPLVVSLHGGLMTGWGQAIYTSWTMVADRDGFIVLFPNAGKLKRWQVEWGRVRSKTLKPGQHPTAKSPEENHDNKLLLGLIELMKSKYNIDDGRIFMHGMSMGDMMTNHFARYFGNVLAGAAGSGSTVERDLLFEEDGTVKNRGGALAIFQSRPELNKAGEDIENNKFNRDYWLAVNGCDTLPQISIVGEDNFAFYAGKNADLIYLDIKNRDHGQTFDDAELIWDYLFSGTEKTSDGKIVHSGSVCPREGDKFAIAVARGCKRAWFCNSVTDMPGAAILWQKLKYHGLGGDQTVRGEYLCVPLGFIAAVFGADYRPSEDTLTAELLLRDGRELQFARGSIGCVAEGRIQSMLCEALHRDGNLYISFEWFCRSIYNLNVSLCRDVLYATDHYSSLSANMAELIKDMLSEETAT